MRFLYIYQIFQSILLFKERSKRIFKCFISMWGTCCKRRLLSSLQKLEASILTSELRRVHCE